MEKIAILYTGGTIGMIVDASTGALRPISAEGILSQVPELARFDIQFEVISTRNPIDSSNVTIENWCEMCEIIADLRHKVGGVVLLHGTDTMAYTASALSFMLENIDIPIVITGSQLPMGQLRTDGKENLISAIEIASLRVGNRAMIREVCVYFQSKLFRGNRTHKFSTENFDAFVSPNLPPLAEVGIHVNVQEDLLLQPHDTFQLKKNMCGEVVLLSLFPGINRNIMSTVLESSSIKGVVLETYGSGNASTEEWFTEALKNCIGSGVPVLNITQCNKGYVDQGIYETGRTLMDIGVIGGADLTREAAITKMMFVLANVEETAMKASLSNSIRGEMTAH